MRLSKQSDLSELIREKHKLNLFLDVRAFLLFSSGMSAGDNTLNALTALQIMRTMQKFDSDAQLNPEELRAHVLEDYVLFMTTPGNCRMVLFFKSVEGHLGRVGAKFFFQEKNKKVFFLSARHELAQCQARLVQSP